MSDITKRSVPMEPVVVEATEYNPHTGDLLPGTIVDYACNACRDRTDQRVTNTFYITVPPEGPELVVTKKATWSPPPGAPRRRKPFP